MATEIKIMFWNIQNVYEYKTITPKELEQTPSDPTKHVRKRRKLESNSQKLYEDYKTNFRDTVVNIIDENDPDVVVLVELSVGKNELIDSGTVEPNGNSRVIKASIFVDNWSLYQYQIDLNFWAKLKNKNRYWQSAQSPVNCSDIIAIIDPTGKIIEIKHRNSMFELYGILWDSNKLNIKNLGEERRIEIVNKPFDSNADLPFAQRCPGFAQFIDLSGKDLFSLVMIHSVYGNNMTDRANSIEYISRLKVVYDAVTVRNPGFPLVIAGDFNLDFQKESSKYRPLIDTISGRGLKARINKMTSIGKPNQSDPNSYMKNAYDNIFTRNFSNDLEEGEVFDFVAEFYGGATNIKEALRISDHLPIIAKLKLP
ncbi:hypothetical protein NIES2107_74870 (plasmid) [Nostoc carneum NIES-2107]|nr:hypothetical protein NIES2107_74870 [Nostoc carneum NIES-2107]